MMIPNIGVRPQCGTLSVNLTWISIPVLAGITYLPADLYHAFRVPTFASCIFAWQTDLKWFRPKASSCTERQLTGFLFGKCFRQTSFLFFLHASDTIWSKYSVGRILHSIFGMAFFNRPMMYDLLAWYRHLPVVVMLSSISSSTLFFISEVRFDMSRFI